MGKKVIQSVINRVILHLLVFSIAVRLRCSIITIPVWFIIHCSKSLLIVKYAKYTCEIAKNVENLINLLYFQAKRLCWGDKIEYKMCYYLLI